MLDIVRFGLLFVDFGWMFVDMLFDFFDLALGVVDLFYLYYGKCVLCLVLFGLTGVILVEWLDCYCGCCLAYLIVCVFCLLCLISLLFYCCCFDVCDC